MRPAPVTPMIPRRHSTTYVKQANDPKRLAAQRESREYYEAYPEAKRLEHADQRG